MNLRSTNLQGALEALDLEVLVVGFQEDLGRRCSPLRVCWQGIPTDLEDLCNGEELKLEDQCLFVNPLHEAPSCVLEEHDGQLAPQGLSLVFPGLLACEGLVFCDIEGHRWVDGQPVHETICEHHFQIVPPGNLKWCALDDWRRMRCGKICNEQPAVMC